MLYGAGEALTTSAGVVLIFIGLASLAWLIARAIRENRDE